MTPGRKIGCVQPPAALELELPIGTPVACGLIDAHAGALGLLATKAVSDFSSTLCLISGTSACHMILNRSKMMIPGKIQLLKIGLEEIEKLYKDPKRCQRLTLET